jgi:hypothetical protein
MRLGLEGYLHGLTCGCTLVHHSDRCYSLYWVGYDTLICYARIVSGVLLVQFPEVRWMLCLQHIVETFSPVYTYLRFYLKLYRLGCSRYGMHIVGHFFPIFLDRHTPVCLLGLMQTRPHLYYTPLVSPGWPNHLRSNLHETSGVLTPWI